MNSPQQKANTKQATVPRVVICGAGYIGQQLAWLTLKRGWDLLAVVNRAGDKVGRDIGELSERGQKIGVLVQDIDKVDLPALKADIALIAVTDDLALNFPIYKRFLEAGINVLCHGCDAYHPRWMNPEVAEKIDAVARANGVTFSGSGIWDSSRIWSGIVAAGPCVEVESILLQSQSNTTGQGLYWAELLGAGLSVAEYNQKIKNSRDIYARSTPIPSVYVLQYLGFTVTKAEYSVEAVVKDYDLYCPTLDTHYKAGTVLGTRFVIDVNTEEGVTGRTEWECRVYAEGENDQMLWTIKGTPRTQNTFVRLDPGITTASSLINRTLDVMGAEPGIVELIKFGPLSPRLGARAI